MEAGDSWVWNRMRDRREEGGGIGTSCKIHHSIPSRPVPVLCLSHTSILYQPRLSTTQNLPSTIPTIPNRTDGRPKKFILPWFWRGGEERAEGS